MRLDLGARARSGNLWVVTGAKLGFLAVALGAFGAHALKGRLTEQQLAIYHTAAQYQMYQALALVALGLWSGQHRRDMRLAGWSWVAGITLFSGSLYALAMTDIRVLGAITPFGGVLLLFGWIVFAFRAWGVVDGTHP
jgi:uncharacterized membrane protein YgdD (TMEM256/DUF423 family)